MKNKEDRKPTAKPGSGKKFRIPRQKLLTGAAAFLYFFALCTNQAYATDMWTKADTIMKDVYGKIVGISTIAAIVTASVALLLMNFSKSGKTVDESRAFQTEDHVPDFIRRYPWNPYPDHYHRSLP